MDHLKGIELVNNMLGITAVYDEVKFFPLRRNFINIEIETYRVSDDVKRHVTHSKRFPEIGGATAHRYVRREA